MAQIHTVSFVGCSAKRLLACHRQVCLLAPDSLRRGGRRLVARGVASSSNSWNTDDVAGNSQLMAVELRQKFGHMGTISHKQVGVRDLYKIMRAAKVPEDYRSSLHAMNLLYNFGVKLKHRELASRLLAVAMICEQHDEAVELVKLCGTWLEHPPDVTLVYSVMGHFLDAGQPLIVWELAKAVREDWRMRVEPPLYILAIEAALQLPETNNPLQQATKLYEDSKQSGVRLPVPIHLRLLNEHLQASTIVDANDAVAHLRAGIDVAETLAREGRLHSGPSTATCCSLAWLIFRIDEFQGAGGSDMSAFINDSAALKFFASDWVKALEMAIDNFGCHWGFSAQLPRGLFQALESSDDPKASRLVEATRARFSRFYPAGNQEAV